MRRGAIHVLTAFLAFAALVTALPGSRASAQDRVALVIGNGNYANVPKLTNPLNDAADFAAALRDLHFEVITATDLDKTAFDLKLREFARALRHAHTVLFFYAGHGMQVAGKNYAMPVDARLESAADLQVEAIDMDQVLAVMQSDESRVSLVFIDACRDNPLAQSFARTLPASRGTALSRGLSPVEIGRGALIAFATAPNRTAQDGDGQRNSPFTASLLKHIRTPGLDISLVMRRVTADVESASKSLQVPWMHASLTTDVILASLPNEAIDPTPLPAPPTVSTTSEAIAPSWIFGDSHPVKTVRVLPDKTFGSKNDLISTGPADIFTADIYKNAGPSQI